MDMINKKKSTIELEALEKYLDSRKITRLEAEFICNLFVRKSDAETTLRLMEANK